MTTTVIIVAAFLGAAALVIGVASLFQRDPATAAEDRLDIFAGAAASPRETHVTPDLLATSWDAPGALETLLSRFGNVRQFLEQADLAVAPSRMFLISGLLAGFGAAATLATPKVSLLFAPVLAVVFGSIPWIYAFLRRRRRLANFAKQLPGALELMSRALRAGHSLAAGFQLVAEELQDPIAREFGRCYEEQNLGIPLDEAIEGMTERVPNLDLRFFATAVILQRQTGGDLAEILDKIGYIIRERFKIWGQVQALTGEGRLSGIVLLALPPVLFVTMLRLNYKYVMMLFEDPLGKQMLAGAIVMQILGALVIRKIVNIKV